MATTVIWMGDLLISMSALAPANDSTVEAIAQLLGFERTAISPGQRAASELETLPTVATDAALSTPAPVTSPSAPVERLPKIEPPTGLSTRREAHETLPPAVSGAALSLSSVERLPPIAPRTALSVRRAVAPLRLTSVVSDPPPKPAPLFSPLAGRFIVQELVTSSRFGPDPDIDRLVDSLARREIPQPVPLQERRTLARGVQLLVDDGEGMEPFADDQEALVELIRRLAGDALVDVRTIHEVPDPADPVDPWDPPPLGMTVLAVTDLGLGGRIERGTIGLVTAWQSIAAILAMRGSSLIALVPYPAARWPGASHRLHVLGVLG